MKLFHQGAIAVCGILGSWALTGCATVDYAAELSQPNYGLSALNSGENVDAGLLSNGLYTKSYPLNPHLPACAMAGAGCSPSGQSPWSSFDP